MSVDRAGTAWVLYTSGAIYKVSTKDASCSPSGYTPHQEGFSVFGMGFVSKPDSTTDTLYVAANPSWFTIIKSTQNKGLGKIDMPNLTLSPIGPFDGELTGHAADLTGRGDGRLFGFFVSGNASTQPSVAEIDPQTGHIISNQPQPIPSTDAWAFAHWGGSFYLFTAAPKSLLTWLNPWAQPASSRVHKYTPGEGTKLVVENAHHNIVGAGVSTCAPTTPPHLR